MLLIIVNCWLDSYGGDDCSKSKSYGDTNNKSKKNSDCNGNCIIRKIVITNNNSHFNYMKILRIKNIDNNYVNVTIKES